MTAEDLPAAYNRKPVWQRILVLLAGPLANFLFAVVAYWILFVAGTPALKPVLGEGEPESVAARAGLGPGDEILAVGATETATREAVLPVGSIVIVTMAAVGGCWWPASTATLTAVDLGLSGSLGMAFFGWLAPYVGVKVFGGPVFWTLSGADVTGTDVHHYQVALGAAVVLPGGFDLLVEGAPLGEQSVTASLGFAF